MAAVTIHTSAQSTTDPASLRRRRRASSVAVAVVSTSVIYLAASAAAVDFRLTDPGAAQALRLNLAAIVSVTLLFGVLGWAALAVVERRSRRARAVWSTLAGAVLLLSYVPIAIEQATPATKATLAIIHTTVALALLPMLRHSPTAVRGPQ